MTDTIRINPAERDAIIGALRVQLNRARMTQSDKDLRTKLIERLESQPEPAAHRHRYEWQPSGRGVGFDRECSICGHCQNLKPIC